MDLTTLSVMAQIASAVSVVISLIYLAAQIRQNTRAVRNSTHHALTVTRLDYIALVAQNPDLSHILRVGIHDLLQLNEDERQRFHLIMYYLFSAGENFYYQNRQGQLDTEQWERWQSTLRYYFTQPGIRMWFETNPIPFTIGFAEFLKREFQTRVSAQTTL
jgi:hypothetical protein